MAEENAKRSYETTSSGFKLTFKGPATVEDYNTKAQSVTGCLDDACENTIYRSTLPEWQDKFVEEAIKFLGVPREVNTKATEAAKARAKTDEAKAKVKDVLETVPRYLRRACAGLDEVRKAELDKIAQSVADSIEVDPSPSKRQAKIPADYLAKADSVLDLEEDAREEKITKWLNLVTQTGGTYELERDENNVPVRTSLARLVGEVVKVSL